MDKAPKVGDRVKSKPTYWAGQFEGVVIRVYPKREYLVADDDPRWDDPEFIAPRGGLLPESEWQVAVEVDGALPENWPYPGSNKIAPSVSDLMPA